jgi:hypothetical protein
MKDRCPREAEDRVAIEDSDGCRDLDDHNTSIIRHS